MGNISKITTKFSVLCLDHVSSTQWIHIVEWIEPFAKGSPTGACMKQELKQFDVEIVIIEHPCKDERNSISLSITTHRVNFDRPIAQKAREEQRGGTRIP